MGYSKLLETEKERGNAKPPIKSANGNLSKAVQVLKTEGIILLYIKIMLTKLKLFASF